MVNQSESRSIVNVNRSAKGYVERRSKSTLAVTARSDVSGCTPLDVRNAGLESESNNIMIYVLVIDLLTYMVPDAVGQSHSLDNLKSERAGITSAEISMAV